MHNNTKSIAVAAIQMAADVDRSENAKRAKAMIGEAVDNGADVICLQELFLSRYFCQTENHDFFSLAESIPGPTTEEFSRLARKLGVVLIVPVFERRTSGLFHNSAVVIDRDGAIAGVYRKMHIPDDPNYYEKFYFAPGDLGFQTITTSAAKIGVCICWDQWFPEAARATALTGAELLFYPTAIGWLTEEKEEFGASQLASWQTVLKANAITNGLFVVAPNRIGVESGIEFWGHSMIVNPYGELIATASDGQPSVVMADCDLELIETARTHWPFLRDRRIDAYGNLLRRFCDDN